MLTRRGFMASSLAASALFPGITAAQSASDRKVIVVWCNGGWDTTYLMDPKLGNPEIEGPEVHESGDPDDVEVVRDYGQNLRIVTNDFKRPSVSRFFDAWGDRVAVVNGVYMGSIGHDACRLRMLTGSGGPGLADVSVISGYQHGSQKPLGSVDFSGLSFSGPLSASAGSIGSTAQLKMLAQPDSSFTAPQALGSEYPLFVPGDDDEATVQEVLRARAERYEALRGEAHVDKFAALFESYDRASRFRTTGDDAIGLLPIGKSPGFLVSLELAVEFLAAGLCSSAFVDTAKRWDTHTSSTGQHENFEVLFDGLNLLAESLQAMSLLDSTTVLVLSEMTRTPKYNEDGGKDHWPHTSAMAFGAGVKGGYAFGATNDLLESLPMDFATGEPSDNGSTLNHDLFAASMLELADVDPVPWFGDIPTFKAWKA